MNSSDPVVSPLRQRMLDDMRMRKLGAKTQTGYVRGVRRFAVFLGRSPDTATAEDLRRFQLDLVDHGATPATINATLSALKVSVRRSRMEAVLTTVRTGCLPFRRMPLWRSRSAQPSGAGAVPAAGCLARSAAGSARP